MKKTYINFKNKKIPLIKGKKGCFAAGTMINSPVGYLPIQFLNIGDEVYCFDEFGKICISKITQLFVHTHNKLIEVKYWGGYIHVTPNHWFLNEHNSFNEIENFRVDDVLINFKGNVLPILEINKLPGLHTVYNFTVDKHHTYFANSIRVHNKGGGKGGQTAAPGVESPNSLFSTDILFTTVALGEGPIYKINPNGLQDIEINESTIDDLLNLDGNGLANEEFFHIESATGTLTQLPLKVFGEETVVPQTMSSGVTLKKGNVPGIPKSSVSLQDTSVGRHDSIRFVFNINALQQMNSNGDIFGKSLTVKVTVFNRTGTQTITSLEHTLEGKSSVPFRLNLDVIIPENFKDDAGYKFTVEKTSNDSASSKVADNISFIGWQEIINEEAAYPRTALIGYALKAGDEYTGGVPTLTSLVKGLLVKVPSNYNQPILSNGEIDWRELELPEDNSEFAYSNSNNGYRQQKTGETILTTKNPIIYEGLWDGTFVYAWTQNPVWILYDLLTNNSYGLGITVKNIDKFKFYNVAQYCDAVNSSTGKFIGVDGYSDGTFRYKSRGQFTSIRETLLGIPKGIQVKERRFICDLTIAAQKQVMDLITQIAGIFRGVLFYSGGKISLNVDMPDEVPVAIFNETNIEKDSISISGIEETSILTGVEISYIDPSNHYRREVVRIDDPEALKEETQIENVKQIELTGVTRRSQAIRFGQYLLAASKFIRRKISFNTNIESINLTIGDVIAVSQRVPGTAWGYGGRIFSNSVVGSSNIKLEHYTSPSISNTVFTANTLPLGLRVINKETDRVDLFLLSNTAFSAKNTGNAESGSDFFEVQIKSTLNPSNKTLIGSSGNAHVLHSNNSPTRGSIWTLGEINPNSFYSNKNDKLFKITNIAADEEDKYTIQASEYISNVYTDSDTLINYVPVNYTDAISPFLPPPTPLLNLRPKLSRLPDGSVRNDIEVSISYDAASYPLKLGIETEYAAISREEVIQSGFF